MPSPPRSSTPRPHPPRLDLRVPHGLVPGDPAELIHSRHAEGKHFCDVALNDEDLTGGRLVECVLEGVGLHDVDLAGVTIAESQLRRVVSPHLQAARSSWREVSICGSRLGVAELYDAELSEVAIAESKLDLVNLRGAGLADVVIEQTSVGELDLGGSRVRRMKVTESEIQTLDVTGARLEHVDLRGARISTIIGLEGMRGATVSPEQLVELAPALAEHLGLQVRG